MHSTREPVGRGDGGVGSTPAPLALPSRGSGSTVVGTRSRPGSPRRAARGPEVRAGARPRDEAVEARRRSVSRRRSAADAFDERVPEEPGVRLALAGEVPDRRSGDVGSSSRCRRHKGQRRRRRTASSATCSPDNTSATSRPASAEATASKTAIQYQLARDGGALELDVERAARAPRGLRRDKGTRAIQDEDRRVDTASTACRSALPMGCATVRASGRSRTAARGARRAGFPTELVSRRSAGEARSLSACIEPLHSGVNRHRGALDHGAALVAGWRRDGPGRGRLGDADRVEVRGHIGLDRRSASRCDTDRGHAVGDDCGELCPRAAG